MEKPTGKIQQSLLQNEKHVRLALIRYVPRSPGAERWQYKQICLKRIRRTSDGGKKSEPECIFQARHSYLMFVCSWCAAAATRCTYIVAGTEIAFMIYSDLSFLLVTSLTPTRQHTRDTASRRTNLFVHCASVTVGTADWPLWLSLRSHFLREQIENRKSEANLHYRLNLDSVYNF